MNFSLVTIIAFAIAILIPIAVLYFILTRNFYQTGSFKTVFGAFAYGAIVYGIVALVNGYMLNNEIVDYYDLVQFIAPIEEEILKGLFFFFLFREVKNFTNFVDGVIYGFAIGIGFAVVENFEYLFAYPDAVMNIAIGRVISTNLIHGSATALTGIAFGVSRFSKGLGRVGMIGAGWLTGTILHIAFNNLVTRVNSGMLLVYAAAIGLIATGIIYWQIKRGLNIARETISKELGAADKVTASEAKLATDIDQVTALLAPVKHMFDQQTYKTIVDFLLIQVRLGIHRGNLKNYTDQKMIADTQAEIVNLQGEMEVLRGKVGSYNMLTIRQVFPPEKILYNLVQARIAAAAQDPERQASKKAFWDTLGSRTAEQSKKNNNE